MKASLSSSFLLIFFFMIVISCRNKDSDQGNYKYQVTSWQGTDVYSDRYKGAIKKSRNVITEANRFSGLPGAQIAVAVDGKICWSENFGFADISQGTTIKANTLFRIASVSKILTAAAVAKLIEQGKLDLDTPIINYLPELPEHYAAITTRHLVSHQSGIRHYYGADKSSTTVHYDDVNDALALFVNAPLSFEPGTQYQYSSYGWAVVSAIVQRLSGQPFLKYMSEEIWTPMGMKNTFGQIPESKRKDVTGFYLRTSPGGNWKEAPYEDLSYNWAGAGFSSNANDLALFGNELLNGNFFEKKTIDQLFTPQLTKTNDTTGFGIGFILYDAVNKQKIIGHGGFRPTGRAYLMLFPESNIVVAFTSNAAYVNFADESIVVIANNFLKEKSDEHYFAFNQTLNKVWKGLWEVSFEKDDGQYENAYLNFYEDRNELKGMILLNDSEPRHLEVASLAGDSIQLLATLRSHTAIIKLGLKEKELSGKSYFNKPLTGPLKKSLIINEPPEISRMLEPKNLRNGKKIN